PANMPNQCTCQYQLPDDSEPALLPGRLLPLDIDPIDARRSRAAIAPADHALDRGCRPLEDRFDPPIVEVAHPAFHACATRVFVGRGAKVNTLDSPVDRDVRSHAIHNRAPVNDKSWARSLDAPMLLASLQAVTNLERCSIFTTSDSRLIIAELDTLDKRWYPLVWVDLVSSLPFLRVSLHRIFSGWL